MEHRLRRVLGLFTDGLLLALALDVVDDVLSGLRFIEARHLLGELFGGSRLHCTLSAVACAAGRLIFPRRCDSPLRRGHGVEFLSCTLRKRSGLLYRVGSFILEWVLGSAGTLPASTPLLVSSLPLVARGRLVPTGLRSGPLRLGRIPGRELGHLTVWRR